MTILNLGCGTKVSDSSEVVNIDWSIELRLRRNRLTRALVSRIIRGDRLERFDALPDNIMVCNLAKGIPFPNESIDVVYHSHLLEHLDGTVAEQFLLDVKRVLKPGGIQRIVVPDLQKLCVAYQTHAARCCEHADEIFRHDRYVADIIEQCVRRAAVGSARQKSILRAVENLILGDARRRGETHQWMYDEFNLRALLTRLGYRGISTQTYKDSQIRKWGEYGLDTDRGGKEYKPNSLYVEALK